MFSGAGGAGETPARFQMEGFEFTPAIGISFFQPTPPADRSMKRKLPYAAILAGLATLYFFAAKLGLSLAFAYPGGSPVWPPAGLAVAAGLLFGYRVWARILLGGVFVYMDNPRLGGAAEGFFLGRC